MTDFVFLEAGTFGKPMRVGSEGWGVIALQSGLGLARSGVFDQQMDRTVREFQKDHKLEVDGIAGQDTKKKVALLNLWPAQATYRVLPGLVRGILEGESGYACDAQSPVYERNNSRLADLGICQWQTALVDHAAVLQHIDVGHALDRICGDHDRGMRPRHDRYMQAAWVKKQTDPERWAWRLAVGSWNAPSWADIWSKEGPSGLESSQRDHLAGYVDDKVVYVKDWTV